MPLSREMSLLRGRTICKSFSKEWGSEGKTRFEISFKRGMNWSKLRNLAVEGRLLVPLQDFAKMRSASVVVNVSGGRGFGVFSKWQSRRNFMNLEALSLDVLVGSPNEQ